MREMLRQEGLSAADTDTVLRGLARKPMAEQQQCVREMIDLWRSYYRPVARNLTSEVLVVRGHNQQAASGSRSSHRALGRSRRQCRSRDDLSVSLSV